MENTAITIRGAHAARSAGKLNGIGSKTAGAERESSIALLALLCFILPYILFFFDKTKNSNPKNRGVYQTRRVCSQSRHTRDARMWGCRNENKREKPTNYQNYRSHRYP